MSNVYVTRLIPDAGFKHLREQCDQVEINPDDRVLKPDELLEKVRG